MNPRTIEYLIYLGSVALAIVVGLALGALIIWLGGYNPIEAYKGLFETSFNLQDIYYFATTLSYATPVILTGLTFAVSARANIFNIGAEGQVYMGALGAVIIAAINPQAPLALPLALLLGALLGGLWGLIAGLFKALRNVNEVVVTIMLNWVAFWILEYARTGPLGDPARQEKTISMPPSARLPLLVAHTELSWAFVIAIITAIITYIILWRSKIGYYIRVLGSSVKTAKYAGIDTRLTTIYVFTIGGVISGLAGALEICGRPPTYAITTGASNISGFGFSGITVSLLGLNHPLLIIPAAIIIGGLMAGSRGMQIRAKVPLEMVLAVQGLIIVALAVPGFTFLYRRWRIKKALLGEEHA